MSRKTNISKYHVAKIETTANSKCVAAGQCICKTPPVYGVREIASWSDLLCFNGGRGRITHGVQSHQSRPRPGTRGKMHASDSSCHPRLLYRGDLYVLRTAVLRTLAGPAPPQAPWLSPSSSGVLHGFRRGIGDMIDCGPQFYGDAEPDPDSGLEGGSAGGGDPPPGAGGDRCRCSGSCGEGRSIGTSRLGGGVRSRAGAGSGRCCGRTCACGTGRRGAVTTAGAARSPSPRPGGCSVRSWIGGTRFGTASRIAGGGERERERSCSAGSLGTRSRCPCNSRIRSSNSALWVRTSGTSRWRVSSVCCISSSSTGHSARRSGPAGARRQRVFPALKAPGEFGPRGEK